MSTAAWLGMLYLCFVVGGHIGRFIYDRLAVYSCDSCSNKFNHLFLQKLNYGYDELKPIKVCEDCYEVRYRKEIRKEGR